MAHLRCLSSNLSKYFHSTKPTGRYIVATSSCFMSTAPVSSPIPPKPYSQIPKKKGFMKFLDYLQPENLHELVMKRVKELGPLYREKIPLLPEAIMISDPKDVETVVRAEGKWPNRDILPIFREVMENLKYPEGFGTTLKYEEWHRLRKPVSKYMMVPRKVGESHEGLNDVTKDLIHAIRKLRNPDTNIVNDLTNLHFKWSFESASQVVLGKRLGALNIDNVPQDCQDLINHVQDLFGAIHQVTNSLPFHKIYPTKAWKQVHTSMKGQFDIIEKFGAEKIKEIEKKMNREDNEIHEVPEKVDFLTYMVNKGEMTFGELIVNAVGLLIAAIDTTSHTLSWALYCLATNPHVQTKLRNEIMSVVGNEEIVTPEHIQNLPYLRQCIKESQRMYPVAFVITRILNKDVNLSGYHVPEGTTVLVLNYAMGKMSYIFPEPDIYRPERWERGSTDSSHQFASLPFGFGPRMCVGRRLVELELNIALTHIMRSFTVDYTDPLPMKPTIRLALIPSRELNLTFKNL